MARYPLLFFVVGEGFVLDFCERATKRCVSVGKNAKKCVISRHYMVDKRESFSVIHFFDQANNASDIK